MDRKFAAAAALVFAAACTDEPLRPSVAEAIVGDYYLSEESGGIAGVITTYTPEDTRVDVSFRDDGTYRFISRQLDGGLPLADTVVGEWFMTEIARFGTDTFDFRFTNQLPSFLREAEVRFVDGERLLTCDRDIADGFCFELARR